MALVVLPVLRCADGGTLHGPVIVIVAAAGLVCSWYNKLA